MKHRRAGAGNDNWGFSLRGMVGFGQGGNSSWMYQDAGRGGSMDMDAVREDRIGAWPWVGIGLAGRDKVNGKNAGAGGGGDGGGGCGYGGTSRTISLASGGGERSGRSGYGAGTANAQYPHGYGNDRTGSDDSAGGRSKGYG